MRTYYVLTAYGVEEFDTYAAASRAMEAITGRSVTLIEFHWNTGTMKTLKAIEVAS